MFKEAPEVGEFLDGDIYNFAVRGARYGKFYLNSAASGHGKTRMMVGNAASLAFPKIDNDGNVIIKEKYHKVLFVATEQDPTEIQTLLLANISGVNEGKILLGTFTNEEELRLRKAAQIIEKFNGNFLIEGIPDPSIGIVRTKIIKHIYNEGRRDQNKIDELAINNTREFPLFTQGTEIYINKQHALISIRAHRQRETPSAQRRTR